MALYLQRLKRPIGSAFGGVGTLDGFSEQGKKILNGICDIDYMGNSDFELGALGRCFFRMCKNIYEHHIYTHQIKNTQLYFFCRSESKNEYVKKITQTYLNRGNFAEDPKIKEVIEEENDEIIGWIDIDKDVIFSVDEKLIIGLKEFLIKGREAQRREVKKERRKRKREEKAYGNQED